jgi:hypothetical protein
MKTMRQSRVLKRLLALVVLATVTSCLAGCSPAFKSAVRSEDGSLVFTPCSPTSGNVIRVAATKPGADGDYITIWKSTSTEVRVVPSKVRFEASSGDFRANSSLGSLADYDYLDIGVEVIADHGLTDIHSAVFKVSNIGPSYWLRSDGSKAKTACG